MIVDPGDSSGMFRIAVRPNSFSVIKVYSRKNGFLKIRGSVVTMHHFVPGKVQFRVLYEADMPESVLNMDKQKKTIQKKALLKKKLENEFEVVHKTWDASPLLLVFDNRHPEARRLVEGSVEIEGTPHTQDELEMMRSSIDDESSAPVQSVSSQRIHDRTRKRILGVLKSFQSISMSNLTEYSNLSENETRNIVFEMIAEDKVSGRFDSDSDSFISAAAASASREIRSDQQSIAQCMYCSKPLERALKAGDEIACPSCGMINVG